VSLDNPEITLPDPPKRPWLFVYSLVLPALWFAVGVVVNLVIPGKRLGVLGLAALVYVFVSIVAWHFAKRRCMPTLPTVRRNRGLTSYRG
jgi:hypothetical protein